MMKCKICHFCGASFLPEHKGQIYCNEDLGIKKRKKKRADEKIQHNKY